MPGIDETVQVPEGPHAEAFLRRVADFNRRARRVAGGLRVEVAEAGRGPAPVQVTRTAFQEGGTRTWTQPETRACIAYRVTCEAPALALPGWRYDGHVAARRAERDTATGTVDAPSLSLSETDGRQPAAFLDAAFDARGMMRCDHCGTYRNRRMGLVVRDDAGGRRLVGSACARDYLGHDARRLTRFHLHIGALREAFDAERRSGWYALHEYDFAAARRAADEARAAEDARAYPLADIVGAMLGALADQGFYARTDGDGRTATGRATIEALASGIPPADALRTRAEEIASWMRTRPAYAPLFEDPSPVSLGRYRAADPEFRAVQEYRDAGHPPLGRHYPDGATVEIEHVRSEPLDADPRWGGPARTRHEFRDALGSVLIWETASRALDAAIRSGRFRATFRTRRSWIERLRATSAVANLRPVRGPAA